MPKLPIPTEYQEQKRYFEMVSLYTRTHPEFAMISATQNGLSSNPTHVKRMKAAGLIPGYPDIIIDVARHGYNGARIEMKRKDGGAGLSKAQKKWFERLQAQNYYCQVAKGCDEAWADTCWYLQINTGR